MIRRGSNAGLRAAGDHPGAVGRDDLRDPGAAVPLETLVRGAAEKTRYKREVVRQHIIIGTVGKFGGNSEATAAFVEVTVAGDVGKILHKGTIVLAPRLVTREPRQQCSGNTVMLTSFLAGGCSVAGTNSTRVCWVALWFG